MSARACAKSSVLHFQCVVRSILWVARGRSDANVVQLPDYATSRFDADAWASVDGGTDSGEVCTGSVEASPASEGAAEDCSSSD